MRDNLILFYECLACETVITTILPMFRCPTCEGKLQRYIPPVPKIVWADDPIEPEPR